MELPRRCLPIPTELFAPGEAGDEARGGVPLDAFRTLAPDCLPSYDQLTWTTDDRFWVRETSSTDAPGGWDRWLVYEVGTGTLHGTTLPADFLPMAVADSLLLGRWRDEWDVHFVQGYRLAPASPASGSTIVPPGPEEDVLDADSRHIPVFSFDKLEWAAIRMVAWKDDRISTKLFERLLKHGQGVRGPDQGNGKAIP